jgi:hypothetical protein
MIFVDSTACLRHFWAKCKIHLGAPPKQNSVLTAHIQQKVLTKIAKIWNTKSLSVTLKTGGGVHAAAEIAMALELFWFRGKTFNINYNICD